MPEHWVFVRGLTRSFFHWLGFEKEFQNQLNLKSVQCVELAGNGYFFREESSSSIDEAVMQLRAQVLVKDQKIGLLSISLGGMIAARWAEMFPNEISHLVIINSSSSLNPFYERLKPRNYAGLLENILFYNPARLEEWIMKSTSNFDSLWRPQFENLVQFQKDHPVSLKNLYRQLISASKFNLGETPKAKALILTATRDRFVSFKCSQSIANKWGCPIRIHPTAGHDLTTDDGAWVIQKVNETFSN